MSEKTMSEQTQNRAVPETEEVVVAPRSGARRRRIRRVLLIGGPLAVAIVTAIFYVTGGRYVETENAYVKADKVAIAAEVAGQITDVAVRENQPVAKGQVLFQLDTQPFRIALSRAEANLQNVRADIEGMKAAFRQKQEELKLARSDREFAEREYRRQANLAKRKVASETKLDQAKHKLDVSEQQIAVIGQALDQLRARLGGDPDVPVEQHPRYRAALAARDQAALNLSHATVRAPFAGVASKTPEPGQYVKVGEPMMSVISNRHMWIEANFKETDLTHVRPGQPVSVEVDTYPGMHWKGTVASVSQATGAEFSVLPAQNSTGNWVKVVQRIPVRIAVASPAGAPPLRAGMSTQVEIDTGHHRPLPGFLRTVFYGIGGKSAEAADGAH